MSALDWTRAPLSGRLLIEASAGTGKTWTMAALYLRLLLEDVDGRGALGPGHIVVATFTEAAAQELGARLRARLEQALAWAITADGPRSDGGDARFAAIRAHASGDPVAAWLLQRWQGDAGGSARDRQRLLRALAEADRAPVGTLHSLCHRILREYPLDGALGFATLALGDGRALNEALARDLLRRIAAGEPPQHARNLPQGCRDVAALAKRIGLLLQPGAAVTPPSDVGALRATLAADAGDALRDLLRREGHYAHATNAVLNAVKAAVAFLEGGEAPKSLAPLLDDDEIDKDRVLPAARDKVRASSFQSAIARFEVERERLASAERAFWAWWQPELRRAQARLLDESGTLAFDQLIERVRDAVQREGSALPAALGARWPVVLVDEFQDTDAAQYALLDAWQRAAPRGLLAVVGDPKQAIYRFRGGDVAVYLRAARTVDVRMTLAQNQRSHTRYVDALNHVFAGPRAVLSASARSRGADTIRVAPVSAAGRADATPLSIDGKEQTRALVLHAWDSEDGPLANAQARPRALRACAELVVRMLQPGSATLGDRALAPGDIAVLLVSNAEVDTLRRLLQRRGVPVLGQARQSVFDTDAAHELRRVLQAVLRPDDTGALRAALLTSLLGLDARALPAFEAGGGLDDARERFATLRAQWRREGVLAVVLALLREALPRLGAAADGERRLTDVRHLGELLQEEARERPRPEALLAWLDAQIGDDEDGGEGPRRLRLASDARRVRLMTLHGSKGLEFPVVLLPTLWAHEHGARHGGPTLDAADADGRREAVFEKAALQARRDEQQEERFRLLYVALTRAQQACHVFTLPPDRPATADGKKPKSDPERSALDALLARWPDGERGTAHPHVEWRRGWPLPTDMRVPVLRESADAIAPAPPAPGPFTLPGRYSFSGLTGSDAPSALEPHAADDERGDDLGPDGGMERIGLDDSRIDAELTALASVGGTGFGLALHDLLEVPDATRRYVDEPERVLAALHAHGVRRRGGGELAAVVPTVAAMLDRAWRTPLPLPGAPVLGRLPPTARRAEMRFHFVLDGVDWASLRALADAHGDPALIPPARAPHLRGSMSGAIDLVFEFDGRAHVLDWKGNAITRAAASGAGLVAVMDAKHYRFQALLYTVALHRLLRQRLGARYAIERHLGAPVYVFLRAFGLAPETEPELGAWTQAFPPALIDALDAHLAGARA
mgnify:FL=1